MWQEILADARYGLRVATRTPLTTAAVIVTMVLGISVTTAVFSVVDAVLIRPLPFAGSERTVQLFGVNNGDETSSLAYPDLVDFRRTIPAIELLGIVRRSGGTYVGRTEAQQLQLAEVDSEFTRVLDLRWRRGACSPPTSSRRAERRRSSSRMRSGCASSAAIQA